MRPRIGERTGIALVFASNGIFLGSLSPRLPLFVERLEATPLVLGLILFAVMFGSLIGSAVSPVVIDRLGAVRSARWSLALAAVSVSAGIITESVPLVLPAFLLLGFGDGIQDVAMNVESVGFERRAGRSVMHGFHAAWSAGALFAAAVSTLFAVLDVSIVAHLVGAAAFTGTMGWIASGTWQGDALADPATRPALRWPPMAIVPLAAAAAAGGMVEVITFDWSALHFTESLGAASGVAASAVLVAMTTMVIARLTGDRFVDALGPYRSLGLFAAVAAVGVVIVLASQNIATGMIGVGLAGFGAAFTFPAVMTLAAARDDLPDGVGIGTVSTVARAGFMMSPLIAGTIADANGIRWAFAPAVVAAVLLAIYGTTRRVGLTIS